MTTINNGLMLHSFLLPINRATANTFGDAKNAKSD